MSAHRDSQMPRVWAEPKEPLRPLPVNQLVASGVPVPAGNAVVTCDRLLQRHVECPGQATTMRETVLMGRADRRNGPHVRMPCGGVERQKPSQRRSANAEWPGAFVGQPGERCDDIVDHPGVRRPTALAVAAEVKGKRRQSGFGESGAVVAMVRATAADAVQDDDRGHPDSDPPHFDRPAAK